MKNIRKATKEDLGRIAEIFVFNYRVNFYPIFKNDEYYYKDMTVLGIIEEFMPFLPDLFVYDDGIIKGFIHIKENEVHKLFVEPLYQSSGIGGKLLEFAKESFKTNFLWALEKNTRAISFYERHGFHKTEEKKLEEDTPEYLIKLEI